MRRKSIALILFCFTGLLLFPPITVRAEKTNYTYTYDYWEEDRESPDAYKAEHLITGDDLGVGDFKEPQGMYVRNQRIYICDTGNNRIVIMEEVDNDYVLVDEFSEFKGASAITTLAGPQDIYVSDNGDMYICDTNNQRILHLNNEYELIKEMTRPVDGTVDQASDFLPLKAVADKAGRVIALVKNYNKGFVEYKNTGEFSGFIGANDVKFNMRDYIWKLIATKEQRAQMEQFVPTEYNNLSLDQDDFIYCTTSVFDEVDLRDDKAKPIRKLNAMGTDILTKNGVYPPIGDLWWGNAAGVSGASKFIDITAMENDTYYAIDRSRGRIFGYNSQGQLLYAFGGLGNRLGYFQYPTALDHMGNNLLILDSRAVGITVMTLTQYGQLINNALAEYKIGNYDESAKYWKKVLMQNGNYDLAYIGIGRARLRQDDYEAAMDNFEIKYDDNNYSKAFVLHRKLWIEEKIGWIMAIFFSAILLPSIIGFAKKVKREVSEL